MKTDFVPLFISPPSSSITQGDDGESRLFQDIRRSRVADQGLCVLAPNGQALIWTVMFDHEPSIVAFLDHSLEQWRTRREIGEAVKTERYLRFPSRRQSDLNFDTKPTSIADRHRAEESCPALAARARLPARTITVGVFGRALEADGEFSTDTVHQEHFARDQFAVTPRLQAAIAKVFEEADPGAVRLPDEFVKLCVTHAYLGQTDVRPCYNPLGAESELERCEFWAEKTDPATTTGLWRVQGVSEVTAHGGKEPTMRHEIRLTWEGFIEVDGKYISRLLLSARGTENLKWTGGWPSSLRMESAAAHLVAGRPIDLDGDVHYGLLGKPAPKKESVAQD